MAGLHVRLRGKAAVIDTVIWWTGAATWTVLALLGLAMVSEWIINRIAQSFGLSRAFIAWAWDREKSRRKAMSAPQ